jgi:hypothetical protein
LFEILSFFKNSGHLEKKSNNNYKTKNASASNQESTKTHQEQEVEQATVSVEPRHGRGHPHAPRKEPIPQRPRSVQEGSRARSQVDRQRQVPVNKKSPSFFIK